VTATIARLILAMLILPVTGAVFLLTFIAVVARSGGQGPPTVWAVGTLWMIVYAFVATYWILLWRSTVKWTAPRVRNTALAGLAALAGGAALALAAITMNRQIPPGAAVLLAGGTVPITWVLGTVLLWRETATERLARMSKLVSAPTVLCPFCGYNLSGLREARCPECGASFTLDELAASQPQRNEHPAEL
jgi:hypothetical protein